ncbi:MAG: hypothetical protein AAGF47_08570 [Planctomycetota bacterium]
MKAWQTALIGVGAALVMVLLSAPITLYMAIGTDGSLKPAAAGVFGFWIALLVVCAVAGALVPRLLRSVDARLDADQRKRDQSRR